MKIFNQQLAENPLKTRDDFVQSLIDLINPLYKTMREENLEGRVHLGESGAVYDENRRDIEGFMRTLWGVGPLCSTQERAEKFSQYYKLATEGILAGTNPNSQFYWGKLDDYDQLFVEMGSLATFLILTRKFFWSKLDKKQQLNIYKWMDQINHQTIPQTNWLFFRILVNTFFEIVDADKKAIEYIDHDLAEINTYYLDDGWYFDGYRNQIDYYIAWGMQYYGVLFSKLTPDINGKFAGLFKLRAQKFSESFKNWFDQSGTALPYGRSQTYRFAQSSFWAVAAFAKIMDSKQFLGEAKYLLMNNMRSWFRKKIFSKEGFLTVGYGYSNLDMAEGYNAPGSPYWALKNYIILALPDDDIFWHISEVKPQFDQLEVNSYSRMLLVHGSQDHELQVFTVGQHSHEHAHGASKYEKFVYSTTFGFSVRKDNVLPKQGAFDSTLAVSDSEYNYSTVFGYKNFKIHDNYVCGDWQPWPDVDIQSFIIPFYPFHIRVHIIDTERPFNLIEGSFSAPKDGKEISVNGNSVFYQSSVGTTGIISFNESLRTELGEPEPNTNVYYQRTVLPQLVGKIEVGKSVLISGYYGSPESEGVDSLEVKLNGSKLIIRQAEREQEFELKEII